MNRRAARLLLACVVCTGGPALLVSLAGPASAHPLGNSSTNVSSEVRVEPKRVVVHHVVDLAEIRTVQLLPAVDRSGDGEIQPAEGTAYAASACAGVAGPAAP